MATPFMGEIKFISWNFPPKGWAFCNGQFLPINQNQALFSLLGTTYGGNGQTTFALPNLQGRVPIHVGAGFTQGQAGGAESHTVNQSQLPQHIHVLSGTNNPATTDAAGGAFFAQAAANVYGEPTGLVAMAPGMVSSIGGTQPHENRMPYLVLNAVIALQGIFPSQN